MLQKLLMMTGLTTPLCDTDEINCWEAGRPFTTTWPQNQQKSNKATEVKKTIKKKPKRVRTAFTTDQLRTLERVYNSTKYIDRVKREQLSASLNIQDKSIKVWFQNRRMKEKRNSESSGDSSIESYSTAGSPPVSVQQNIDVNKKEEKVESSNSMYSAQVSFNAESQYQVPHVYYDNHTQYNGASDILLPNTTFYYDTNVYPTQYYPNYYTEECAQPNTWASDINQINYY